MSEARFCPLCRRLNRSVAGISSYGYLLGGMLELPTAKISMNPTRLEVSIFCYYMVFPWGAGMQNADQQFCSIQWQHIRSSVPDVRMKNASCISPWSRHPAHIAVLDPAKIVVPCSCQIWNFECFLGLVARPVVTGCLCLFLLILNGHEFPSNEQSTCSIFFLYGTTYRYTSVELSFFAF